MFDASAVGIEREDLARAARADQAEREFVALRSKDRCAHVARGQPGLGQFVEAGGVKQAQHIAAVFVGLHCDQAPILGDGARTRIPGTVRGDAPARLAIAESAAVTSSSNPATPAWSAA